MQLAALGGTRPYAWSLLSGTLPDGLTFDPSGALLGIPTVTGLFPVSFAVADTATHTAQLDVSLAVTGTIPPLAIATATLPPRSGLVALPRRTGIRRRHPPVHLANYFRRTPAWPEPRER